MVDVNQQEQAGSQYTDYQNVENPEVDMIFRTQQKSSEYHVEYAKQKRFGVSKKASTDGKMGR